uniref:Selenoprotein S n=1 Tax=Heliothis virescens TaxID=7102 RepID=A0A2A4JD79_HELVI
MDPLIEEEVMAEEELVSAGFINPISFVLQFLATYGWALVGGAAALLYALHKLRPHYHKWQQAREDAVYHKNPDVALARMEAVQRARELQQQKLAEASQRALEMQKEREERKRLENVERLQKYGGGGQRLGERGDDYMPLSAGASTSSYRPPKKSKCGGGGCGR